MMLVAVKFRVHSSKAARVKVFQFDSSEFATTGLGANPLLFLLPLLSLSIVDASRTLDSEFRRC
jgi:hypothetical protein